VNPLELIFWGFAIGGAAAAAVVGFVWVLAMFGVDIEWEPRKKSTP